MKEVLDNQQARPGDATQFMHVIFSSDEEMMNFYLTLNRFVNPSSYLVERTDAQRLEDLMRTLCNNVLAFDAINSYKSVSVKDVIKGFGMHMMNMQVSNNNRLQSAEAVGVLMDCIMNTAKNRGQFKGMSCANRLHLANVKYLLERLGKEDKEKKEILP